MKNLILLFFILPFCISISYSQTEKDFDDVGATSDGLTAVMKDGKWGFVNAEAKLVVNYREDLVLNKDANSPVFKNGLCLIKEIKAGISYYGYIDKDEKNIVPAEYLGISNFENGYAIALKVSEKSRGKSMLGKEIIDHYYDEVLIDTQGNVIKYLYGPKLITLTKGYYKKPEIISKILSDKTIASMSEDGKWNIIRYK